MSHRRAWTYQNSLQKNVLTELGTCQRCALEGTTVSLHFWVRWFWAGISPWFSYLFGERVQFLHKEDPLEKGMATHSSILSWRIPWTKEPGRLQSMGVQIVRHNWVTNTFTFGRKMSHSGPTQVILSNLQVRALISLVCLATYFIYSKGGTLRHFSNMLLLDSEDDEAHFNYNWLLRSSVNVRPLFQVLEKHKNHKERD